MTLADALAIATTFAARYGDPCWVYTEGAGYEVHGGEWHEISGPDRKHIVAIAIPDDHHRGVIVLTAAADQLSRGQPTNN